MKISRRILSAFLIVAFAVSILPAALSARAEDSPIPPPAIFDFEYMGPSPYALGRDEEAQLRVELVSSLGEQEQLVLRLEMDPSEGNDYQGRTYDFIFAHTGGNEYTATFDLTMTSEQTEILTGEYKFLVGIVNFLSPAESLFTNLNLILEVADPEPLLETPEVTSVSMNPSGIVAGGANSFYFSAEMEFEDNYAMAGRKARLVLSRYVADEDAQGGVSKEEISGSTVTFSHATYNADYIYFSTDIYSPHPSYMLTYSGFEAGEYVLELVPNYGTEYEDENVIVLKEFEVTGPPVSPVTLYVHTEKGLAEADSIGNQDVVTLQFDDWSYYKPDADSLYIMPAGLVIGSYGWKIARSWMHQVDGSSISYGDGIATIPSIVMSARDIPAGEYVFFESWSYVVSEPFTIFEGESTFDAVLQSIEISSMPYRRTYLAGDTLDLSGLEVTAQYDSTGGRAVSGYTSSIAHGAVLAQGDTTVLISYTEGEVTRTASFEIEVLAPGSWGEAVNVYDSSNGIIISAGSGNRVISGSCTSENAHLGAYDDYVIKVASGYSGIIRLDDLYINAVSGADDTHIAPVLVESGAKVSFELTGESELIADRYTAAILVESGAEVIITSSSGGSLTASGNASGAGIGGGYANAAAGSITIYGNARVTANSFYGAGIGGAGSRNSSATVIISGDAVVIASSEYGAGIGGGSESSGGGVGGNGGVVMIGGNANVTASSIAGPGIGGGFGAHTGGDGGIISIGENALVNAFSEGGTAIGGGRGGSNGSGGFGGKVSIDGNAVVNALSTGIYASGIGGGPNHPNSAFHGGSMGINLQISGGTVNAANTDRGFALGGNVSTNFVHIDGGSVYPASQAVVNPQNTLSENLVMAKLTAEDGSGNLLDGLRLCIGEGYEAVTGKSPVWDAEAKAFTEEFQQGVAYVWLPAGAEYAVKAEGESGVPAAITLVQGETNEFTITFDSGEEPEARISGSVSISGDARYGASLTADTSGLLSEPEGMLGALSYQWKRAGESIPGATGSSYLLTADDIEATLTVTVCSAGCKGEVTSAPTGAVEKADGPAAPLVSGSYTGNGQAFTYTVDAIDSAQYRADDGAWQSSNVFTGFAAGETVSFYARIAATETHKAGEAGSTGAVSFEKLDGPAAPALDFSVSPDRSTISITELEGAEYKFGDGEWSNSGSKGGYSGTETVTIQIRYAGTATHNPSQPCSTTVSLAKEQQSAPPAFELEYLYDSGSGTFTVTIPVIENAEYSFNGADYSAVRTATAAPGESVTGYARYAESATHSAGPAARASLTLPYYVTSVTVSGEDGKSAITTKGGSLQLTAAVLPSSAVQELDWSIVSGGSCASVDTNGLLTASGNGTVTVRASATDGSGIYGEFNVTISGQGGETFNPGGGSGAPKSSSLSSTKAEYDADSGETLSVTLSAGSRSLNKISYGGNTLLEGKDYTVSKGVYTFTEEFLSSLEPGTHELVFDMSGGEDLIFSVSIATGAENPDTPLSRGTLPFEDVTADNWFYEAVSYVYENGIMQGTGEQSFGAGAVLSRGALVQMLYNLEGRPATGASGFNDVPQDGWYADAVTWAEESGIALGDGSGLFSPEQEMSREAMAVMLYRYCLYKGIELPALREAKGFADGGLISSWATEAISALYQAGVLNGRDGGLFDPQGTATRAEAAQMFMNFMKAIGVQGSQSSGE